MRSLLLRILLLHFLSFPQHNPRLNSAQSWCFHYIRLYTKLILFSSLYYNFIYILKKKENSNEHITKHNLRLLKPLPIPKTATYGYYCEGKMYKAGASVKLEGNMAFTSVNKLDLEITNGVSIRLVTGETGLRYKATIVSDNNEAINSNAIKEGILIT